MNLTVAHNRTRGRVIVIGAGIAGLTSALQLAQAGFSVSVFEQHQHVGGKIRTFPSSAGPIDAGPTVLTMRPVFEELFKSVGEKLDQHLQLVRQKILARHWWPDGTSLDLFDNYESSQEAIYQFAGLKGFREFQVFMQRTKRLFDAFEAPMMLTAEPSQWNLTKHVIKHPSLIKDMAPLQSLAKTLAGQFSDPRLAQLFGRYATYVGGSPYQSPALLSLIWQAEARGVWKIQGGMHALPSTLKKLAQERGAQFHLNTKVKRLITDNSTMNGSAVKGVLLENGDQHRADIVLFNGDPRALATGHLGDPARAVAQNTVKEARSLSARVWSFEAKIEGPDLVHHNVFFGQDPRQEFDDIKKGRMPEDPTIYICAQDRGTNKAYPDMERFEIILNAPSIDMAHTLEQEFEKCKTLTLKTLARFGLRFTPEPDKSALTTPTQFAQLFPASEGSLYGQSPHGMTAAFRRPTCRTAILGLYLAGGGAHPGAGVPMATLSARHAVEAILKDQTSMSPSPQMGTHGGISMASVTEQTAQFRSSDS